MEFAGKGSRVCKVNVQDINIIYLVNELIKYLPENGKLILAFESISFT